MRLIITILSTETHKGMGWHTTILDSYYHQNGDFAIAGLPFLKLAMSHTSAGSITEE